MRRRPPWMHELNNERFEEPVQLCCRVLGPEAHKQLRQTDGDTNLVPPRFILIDPHDPALELQHGPRPTARQPSVNFLQGLYTLRALGILASIPVMKPIHDLVIFAELTVPPNPAQCLLESGSPVRSQQTDVRTNDRKQRL